MVFQIPKGKRYKKGDDIFQINIFISYNYFNVKLKYLIPKKEIFAIFKIFNKIKWLVTKNPFPV